MNKCFYFNFLCSRICVNINSHNSNFNQKTNIKITDLIEGDDDDTPEESALSDELPYKTLSSTGLRRFGTMNSLERVSSDDPLEQDGKIIIIKEQESVNQETRSNDALITDEAEETGDSGKEEDKADVKTHSPETSDSLRGWTVRAGSFVAAKMAFFERLSSPDNSVTVRKTTFLER